MLVHTSREKQERFTIPEVVKVLIVPPTKRSDLDYQSIAKKLFEFISSIESFKEGEPKSYYRINRVWTTLILHFD